MSGSVWGWIAIALVSPLCGYASAHGWTGGIWRDPKWAAVAWIALGVALQLGALRIAARPGAATALLVLTQWWLDIILRISYGSYLDSGWWSRDMLKVLPAALALELLLRWSDYRFAHSFWRTLALASAQPILLKLVEELAGPLLFGNVALWALHEADRPFYFVLGVGGPRVLGLLAGVAVVLALERLWPAEPVPAAPARLPLVLAAAFVLVTLNFVRTKIAWPPGVPAPGPGSFNLTAFDRVMAWVDVALLALYIRSWAELTPSPRKATLAGVAILGVLAIVATSVSTARIKGAWAGITPRQRVAAKLLIGERQLRPDTLPEMLVSNLGTSAAASWPRAKDVLAEDGVAVLPLLIAAFESRPAARFDVVETMVKIGAVSLPALERMLTSPDPYVRAAIPGGLQQVGTLQAWMVPLLLPLLKDPDAQVRSMAAGVLVQAVSWSDDIRTAVAAVRTSERLTEPTPTPPRPALPPAQLAAAIARSGDQALRYAAMRDPDPVIDELVKIICESRSELHVGYSLGALIPMSWRLGPRLDRIFECYAKQGQDTYWRQFPELMNSLRPVGPELLPRLLKLAEAQENPRHVARALEVVTSACVPLLIVQLSHARPGVRRAAASALSRQCLDSPAAAAALKAHLTDPDEWVRTAAEQGLNYIAEAEGTW